MLRTLLSLSAAVAVLSACGSSPVDAEPFEGAEGGIEARGPGFTFVSLRNLAPDSAGVSAIVPAADSATTRWDLAFRGTEILLNGGGSGLGAGVGAVLDVPFDAVADALADTIVYRRDGESPCPSGPARAVCTGPGDGLFETAPGGGVTPIPRRTLVLRLGDGQGYAKVAIQSFIDDVYTIRYAVNPDGSSFLPDEE